MPILGQPFAPWVTEQINVRQKSLGKYSTSQIQANLVKTPWIRLASSVNLEFNSTDGKLKEDSAAQKLINSGFDVSNFDGFELAKKSILLGGVVDAIGSDDGVGGLDIKGSKLNSGLNNGSSPFNGAYGWGGIEERGYVPMPGITQADVQYLNNGALTKTTINIKCFSRKQFQIIEVLYLRPGYTLLLEFGHSTYLDNNNEFQSFDNFSTKPLRTLFSPKGKTQYDIYNQIAETRDEYDGNYDAVYGKISNFNWQFNPDGSYDCQVQLTGMGDVIESLKLNISDPFPISSTDGGDEDAIPDSNPIIANKSKTRLNTFLFDIYQSMVDQTDITAYNVTLFDFASPTNNFKEKNLKIPYGAMCIPTTSLPDNDENVSPQGYITFGTLISYIQNSLLLYNKSGDSVRTPITIFDMDFDNLANDENYILKLPGGFSADPTICLIPYNNVSPPIPQINILKSKINEKVKKYSSWGTPSPYAGRLAAIYVNMGYISTVLSSLPQSEDNKISILDFLKQIIKGITQSLGGINQIRIESTIDGKIQFVEDIPQNFEELTCNATGLARFNIYGVKPGIEGSFVKNINLSANLGSDYADMISIGAQNNGNQLSENATSFSTYNLGLIDRIVPEKVSYTTNDKKGIKKEEETITSNFEKIQSSEVKLMSTIYNDIKFIPENISALKSLNTTHAKLILGRYSQPTKDQQIQSPFFLPFRFSLEIEGLSGMILHQKFRISDGVLPSTYDNDAVEIQIEGINHSINTTGWTTKLDTLTVPSFKPKKRNKTTSYNMGNAPAFTGNSSGGGSAGSSTGAGGGQYQSGTGEFDIDLTRTLNSNSRMAIVNKFGWPILIEERGGKYYGQQKGLNSGRVVYTLNSEYKSRNNKTFTYTYKNGKTFSKTLHVGMHDSLRQTLKKIDDAGFSDGVKNIDASIYARDTTNAPGLLSGHSFGVAMDFNSSVYGYGNSDYKKWEKDVKDSNSANYKAAKAIEIAKNTGLWNWGGNYTKNKDTHHFTFKPYSS